MSFLAKHVTGRYNFIYIPIVLPTSLVLSLLTPPFTADSSPIMTSSELAALGMKVPLVEEGFSWVVVQVGKQMGTGVSMPMGRSDFYEAKLEIPFLRHSLTSPTTPFTLKQHLLFSSSFMQLSSSNISGLRSSKATFSVPSLTEYEARDWISVRTSTAASTAESWSKELVKSVAEGWWVGERTGANATTFHFEDLSPPFSHDLIVRLNLPRFLGTTMEETRRVVEPLSGIQVDEEGWLEVRASGWELSVKTKMEAKKLTMFE